MSQTTDGFLPSDCCRLLKFIKSRDATRTVRIHSVFTIVQFFTHHFFNYIVVFWDQCTICDISAHISNFSLPPMPSACLYWNQVAMQNEWWKAILFLRFDIFILTIFSISLLFIGWMCDLWYLSSQLDLLTCHRHQLLTFIKTKQQSKKNGDKLSHTYVCMVLSLAIFSIKLLFLVCMCIQWKLCPLTDFCTAADTNGSQL